MKRTPTFQPRRARQSAQSSLPFLAKPEISAKIIYFFPLDFLPSVLQTTNKNAPHPSTKTLFKNHLTLFTSFVRIKKENECGGWRQRRRRTWWRRRQRPQKLVCDEIAAPRREARKKKREDVSRLVEAHLAATQMTVSIPASMLPLHPCLSKPSLP